MVYEHWIPIAIVIGAVAAVTVVGLIIDAIRSAIKRRELLRQVKAREVPEDYKQVGELSREMNEALLDTGMEDEAQYVAVQNLRERVSRIRVEAYDKAKEDVYNGIEFAIGITNNSYLKGSGEAKQWARGYCQASGTQPKEWMKRA